MEVAILRALSSLPRTSLWAAMKLSAWVAKLARPSVSEAVGAASGCAAGVGVGGAGQGAADYEIVSSGVSEGVEGEGEGGFGGGGGGKNGSLDKSTHSMLHPPAGSAQRHVDLSLFGSPDCLDSPGSGSKYADPGAGAGAGRRVRGLQGKATYVVLDQAPEAYLLLERPLPVDAFLSVERLNVMSGDAPLFDENGWSFRLLRGQRLVISGPSGVGKTRLLRAISQLDENMPSVRMNLCDTLFPEASVPAWRCRVIYVPQSIPPCAGAPADLLKEALGYHSRTGYPRVPALLEGCDAECAKMEDALGLERGKLAANWISLSGGERQRCCIGIALMLGSTADAGAVVLMDEPTAACCADTMVKVERAIIASGLTTIMITHDERQAQRVAHKTRVISPHGLGSP